MQIYDILMLIVMVAAVLFGLWKGLAWQIASLAAIGLSYFVTVQFRPVLAGLLPIEAPWNQLASAVMLFVGASLGVWIGFRFVKDFINRVKLKEFDRSTGAVLGGIKGVIVCLMITLFAMSSLAGEQKQMICQSYSGYYMALLIDQVQENVPEGALSRLMPYIDHLDEELKCARDPNHRHVDHSPPPAAVDPYAPTAVDPSAPGSPSPFTPIPSPDAPSEPKNEDLDRAAAAARAAAEAWFRNK